MTNHNIMGMLSNNTSTIIHEYNSFTLFFKAMYSTHIDSIGIMTKIIITFKITVMISFNFRLIFICFKW
jgi:hypothetical protein